MPWGTPNTSWTPPAVPVIADLNRWETNTLLLSQAIGYSLGAGSVGQSLPTGIAAAGRFVGVQAGAPSSGTFLAGDFTVDSNGYGFYECITGGSPGTWVLNGKTAVMTGFGMTSNSAAAAWRGVMTGAATSVGVQSGLPADRAGSIIGIGLRSSGNINAGTCTVTVTVAGSNGTLAASLSGGASLSQATQATGVDTFTAGQQLSMSVTTGSTTNTTVEGYLLLAYKA